MKGKEQMVDEDYAVEERFRESNPEATELFSNEDGLSKIDTTPSEDGYNDFYYLDEEEEDNDTMPSLDSSDRSKVKCTQLFQHR